MSDDFQDEAEYRQVRKLSMQYMDSTEYHSFKSLTPNDQRLYIKDNWMRLAYPSIMKTYNPSAIIKPV